MSLLLRRTVRVLWAGRWVALGIAWLVAVVTWCWAGGERAQAMFEHTRASWYRDLHLADVDVRCSPARPEAAQGLSSIEGVADAETRLVVPGTLEGRRRTPAWIQVLRGGLPRLNGLHVLQGRAPRPGEAAAVVDRSLMASHDLRLGQPLHLRVGTHEVTVPVVGAVLSPEHPMLPVHPEYAMPLPGTVALVAVTETAVADVPRVDRFNSILVTLAPAADAKQVAARITDRLPLAVNHVVHRASQPGHQFTEMTHRTFGIYWPAVAGVMVLVAMVLLVVAVRHWVARQRRGSAILRTLGHSRHAVVAALLPLAVVPSAVGFALGAWSHGLLAHHLFETYRASVGLPPVRDPGPAPLGWLAVACVVLPAAVAAWVALRATSAPPAQAMRTVQPIAFTLGRRAGLPVTMALALTHVLRRVAASGAAVLGLGAAFALVLAFLLVHVTHRKEVEASVERLGLDLTVQFGDPVDERAWRLVEEASGGVGEPIVSRQALVAEGNEPGRYRRVVCVAPGQWTQRQQVTDGRMFRGDAPEAVVDRWVADQQQIGVGDDVWLYPYANAPDAHRVTVVGILQGVSLGLVAVPLSIGQTLFALPGLATGMHIHSVPDVEAAADALAQVAPVDAVFSLREARTAVRRNFRGSSRMLTLTLILAVFVAVVFLGVLTAMDAADHRRDWAVLRALGWRDGALFGVCVTEVLARGVLALLVALPTAPLLARWIVSRIAQANHYRMTVDHPLWVHGMVVGTVLVLLPLAAWPAWCAARRVPPARLLRVT